MESHEFSTEIARRNFRFRIELPMAFQEEELPHLFPKQLPKDFAKGFFEEKKLKSSEKFQNDLPKQFQNNNYKNCKSTLRFN